MRLPWVSRWRFDDLVGYARASEANGAKLTALLEREGQRYTDLLARYHALKLMGATEVVPPVVPPKTEPDPIRQAITRKAGRNTQLRKAMEAKLAEDRAKDIPEHIILAQIERGVPANEDGEVFV